MKFDLDGFLRRLPVVGPKLRAQDELIHAIRVINEERRVKLRKIHELYESRCEPTVLDCSDGEEEFLANLSVILHGEDVRYGQPIGRYAPEEWEFLAKVPGKRRIFGKKIA